MTRHIVDGNNVMGARPDGWWADRTGAMARIVRLCNAFHQRTGHEVVVVFDGRTRDEVTGVAEAGVSVRFADRPEDDPADAAIVDLIAGASDPGELVVATSDRELAERVEEHGAEVVGGGTFRDRLEELAD